MSSAGQASHLQNSMTVSGSTSRALPMLENLAVLACDFDVVRNFRRRAAEAPNAPAVIHNDVQLTYEELDKRSTSLAVYLREMGVARDVLVGVYGERSIHFIIAALGILRAGGAYLPLDPSYPAERLAFQLADAQTNIVIATDTGEFPAILGSARHVLRCAPNATIADGPSQRVNTLPEECGDLAYVIYTSGSTGRPKGAEITHRNLANMIGWFLRTLQVTSGDRLSHVAAVGFDATVWELWPALVAGATICIADRSRLKDPRQLQEWLIREAVSVSFIPTPMAERLMRLPWDGDTHLRVMMTGGDTLHIYPPPDLPFKFVNNYGPSECTICATSTFLSPGNSLEQLPPIGRPITNTQIYIVDELLRQVPCGVEGEILIAGHGVGRGYRNQPALTAERFIPNIFEPSLGDRVYRTGDRGCFLPDGQIAFKGRFDDQIKIRGVRMEPAEIETALNEHPNVQSSAVIARQTTGEDRQLVAYISLRQPATPGVRELRNFLSKRLPEPMVPAVFVVLPELPLNSSGKIDRRALPPPNQKNILSLGEGTEPRDALEKRLQQIWQQLLPFRNIGIHQDFFELGGDSLLALRLLASVEGEVGFTLPVSALLEIRTIDRLARLIRNCKSKPDWSSLVVVQPIGARPPLFCVHSHTGDVFYCEYISRGAGPNQPIYGLQSRAVTGKAPHLTVEEMSEHYLSEIRTVQSRGPYHLFGFCFGGMVAFDIARRLEAIGEEVGFLGFYDSPAPGTLKGWPLGQFTYLRRRTRNEWRKLLAAEPGEKIPHILRNFRNLRLMIQRAAAIEVTETLARLRRNRQDLQRLDLEAINIAAAKRFNPAYKFPGRLTLFQSPEVAGVYPVPPREGWKKFAAGGLEVIDVLVDKKGWRGTPFVETVGGLFADVPPSSVSKT